MNRRFLTISLILLILGGIGCSGAGPGGDTSAPSAAGTATSGPATALADLTNSERTRAGLSRLTVNAQLNTAAQLQADQLTPLQTLEHEVPNGRYPTPADRLAAAGYQWQAYGENLASGYPTAADAVAGLMNSPGHRANILNTAFTELGAAYATDASGRAYWVQMFGKPR